MPLDYVSGKIELEFPCKCMAEVKVHAYDPDEEIMVSVKRLTTCSEHDFLAPHHLDEEKLASFIEWGTSLKEIAEELSFDGKVLRDPIEEFLIE